MKRGGASRGNALAGIFVVASLLRCASDDVRVARVALTNASDDYHPNDLQKQRAADVVVDLVRGAGRSCSGTLIAPGVVLTAGHCFGNVSTSLGTPEQVELRVGPKNPLGPASPAPTLGLGLLASTPAKLTNAADVAVVYVDLELLVGAAAFGAVGTPQYAAFVDASSWGKLVSLPVQRPTFTPPPTIPAAPDTTFARKFVDAVGVAGYDNDKHALRKVAFTNHLHQENAAWIVRSNDTPSLFAFTLLEQGDSGGPLFATRMDGTRDPIGVSSRHDSGVVSANVWVDITEGAIAAFISASSVEARTPAWLSRHGLLGTYWRGEVEYSGPCRLQDDRDCDHWVDVRDDCPNDFDPLQRDDDDDGVGNACDNCVAAPNALQRNCNVAAEEAAIARTGSGAILGDACDPVPCAASETERRVLSPTCTPNPLNPNLPPEIQQETLQCVATDVEDRFRTTTQGSFFGSAMASNVLVPDTAVRYCQRNSVLGFQCERPQVLFDSQLNFEPSPPLDPDLPWHKITFGKAPGIQLPPVGDTLKNWIYGKTLDTNTWFFFSDYDRWVTNAGNQKLIPLSNDPCCASASACPAGRTPTTCLEGAFWFNSGSSIPFGRGPNLANFYWGLPVRELPYRPDRGSISYCSTREELVPVRGGDGTLVPQGLMWLPQEPSHERPFFDVAPLRDTLVLIAALQDDGTGISLEPLPTPQGSVDCGGDGVSMVAKATLLDTGVRILPAIEPDLFGGAAARGVVLGADGSSLLGTLSVRDGRLTLGASRALVAHRSAGSAEDGVLAMGASVRVSVPASVEVVRGSAGSGAATLSFVSPSATVTCTYAAVHGNGETTSQRYGLTSCTSGAGAGDHVLASSVTLHVISGDETLGAIDARTRLDLLENASPFVLPSAPGPSPPPRSGAVLFFSRALGSTIVAGGFAPQTGLPRRDVWVGSLDGAWRELPMGEVVTDQKPRKKTPAPLGTIVAATFSTRGGLVLVDVAGKRERLLHLGEGMLVERAAWPSKGARTFLSVDAGGDVLLTRSRDGKILTLRVAIGGDDVRIRGRLRAAGDLLFPPVISARSFAYPVRKGDGIALVRIAAPLPLIDEDRSAMGEEP